MGTERIEVIKEVAELLAELRQFSIFDELVAVAYEEGVIPDNVDDTLNAFIKVARDF